MPECIPRRGSSSTWSLWPGALASWLLFGVMKATILVASVPCSQRLGDAAGGWLRERQGDTCARSVSGDYGGLAGWLF